MTLEITLLGDYSAISRHLKDNPVDLMVYDERNSFEFDAIEGIQKIKSDMKRLGQLWGPDFLFPASRIVAILDQCYKVEKKVFELARLNVRDVQIAPKNTEFVISWLGNSSSRYRKTRYCGDGLIRWCNRGFFISTRCSLCFERAFTGKKLNSIDVFSGISSGSIAGALAACEVDIEEVIKSIHGNS